MLNSRSKYIVYGNRPLAHILPTFSYVVEHKLQKPQSVLDVTSIDRSGEAGMGMSDMANLNNWLAKGCKKQKNDILD